MVDGLLQEDTSNSAIGADNRGYKLMAKLGWSASPSPPLQVVHIRSSATRVRWRRREGEGLGTSGQGIMDVQKLIDSAQTARAPRRGLGFASAAEEKVQEAHAELIESMPAETQVRLKAAEAAGLAMRRHLRLQAPDDPPLPPPAVKIAPKAMALPPGVALPKKKKKKRRKGY
jgi:hypothetical protein